MSSGYSFILAKWQDEAPIIRAVREQVLVDEFGLSREMLEQVDDSCAFHVLVYDAGSRAVATARMQPDGRIDYVAVLRPWRGRTVGGALLGYLYHIAWVRKLETVWTVVPESARRFFEKNRFLPADEAAPTDGFPGLRYARPVQRPGTDPAAMH